MGLAGCADGGSTNGGLENAPDAAAIQENVTASMQVDVEIGMRSQGRNATALVNMTFHSFNEPTDITLPAGAENATRMGGGAGSLSPSRALAAPP